MPRTRRDFQRWARKGTTEQRGYGARHQAERRRRLAAYQPGDRCAIGGEPMLWPRDIVRRYVDLPHTDDRTGYLPGLACSYHNRAEGGTRGNRMRAAARPPQWVSARRW